MNGVQAMNFEKAIFLIEKKVIDLTAATDLFRINEFIQLYENSDLYIDDAINYLSASNNSVQQKMIAIYTMQKLPL